MQLNRTTLIFVFLFLGLINSCKATETAQNSFKSYWLEFHQAFVTKDYKKLQSLSAPTITLRGAVEGIKPKKIQPKDFEKTLAAIMTTSVREYQGDKLVSLTVYEKVKSLVDPKLEASPDRQWIDDFVFTKEKGEWKLKEIYWEELE